MLIFGFLFGLSMLLLDVRGQKTIKFVTDFPKNYQLSKGDLINLPLDDYVNIKGSDFVIAPSGSGVTVMRNLQYSSDLNLNKGSQLTACDQMLINGGDLILVCDEKWIAKVTVNNQIGEISNSVVSPLAANSINTAYQDCMDMVINGGEAYVLCVDKQNAGSGVMYIASLDTMAVRNTKVSSLIAGNLRMVQIPYGTQGVFTTYVYDYSPYEAMPGNVTFSKLDLVVDKASNNTISASGQVNLVNTFNDNTMNASIRCIVSLSSQQVMFVLAKMVPGYKEMQFAVVNINDNGLISPSEYNLTGWVPGSVLSSFSPRYIAAAVEVTAITAYVTFADLYYHFMVNLTFNSSQKTIQVGWPSISTLDCGQGATSTNYVGRIYTTSRDAVNFENDRKVIEYRQLGNHDLVEFAIYFYLSKYACSRSYVSPDRYSSVALLSSAWAVSNRKNLLTFFKVAPATFLRINTSTLTAGSQTFSVTAQLNGFNSNSQNLSFDLINDNTDSAVISLQTKNVQAYAGSQIILPFVSSNFQVNNPTFSITSSANRVKYYYNVVSSINLNLSIPDGYAIRHIFSVDSVTQVTTLRKTNAPRLYAIFYINRIGDQIVVTKNSNTPQMLPSQNLFKVFKLGPSIFCMVLKGTTSDAPKLVLTCLENKVDGQVKLDSTLITNDYEINDIQFVQGSDRVDFLMVGLYAEGGGYSSRVLHYFVQLTSDNNILRADNIKPIFTSYPLLASYTPEDILFDFVADEEGSNHVTAKMTSSKGYPMIVKFNMTYEGNAANLKYLRRMKMQQKDAAYCITRNEVIMYLPKLRRIYAQLWDRAVGMTNEDQYAFPLADYNVSKIIQFTCIPEKSMFQVLAIDFNQNKFIMTFRGGESTRANRRLHSMFSVDKQTRYFATGYADQYMMTISGYPGGNEANRTIAYIYYDGPVIFADNTNATANWTVTFNASTSTKSASESINIEIVTPVMQSSPSVTSKVNLPAASDKSTLIDVESLINITGPVMDVQVTGAGANSVQVTRRNNRHKGFPTGEVTKPNKIVVQRDFLTAMYTRGSIKIYGDPTMQIDGTVFPTVVYTKSGSVRDFAMSRYGMEDQAVVIVKEFFNSQYEYSLILLQKYVDATGVKRYSYVSFNRIFTTKDDYEEMQIIDIDGGDIVMSMRSKPELITNLLKLVCFVKQTNGYVLGASTNIISKIDRIIQSYSLNYIGNRKVAILASSFGFVGLQVAIWDTISKSLYLSETNTLVKLSPTESRKIYVNQLRCYSVVMAPLNIECLMYSEGRAIILNVTYDASADFSGEDILSMNKTADIELPPSFEIVKITRGKEVWALQMRKSQATQYFAAGARRVLQGDKVIDNYLSCNNIILTYKPQKSRFVYTGITCSEWGNSTEVDYTIEEIGGRDYIFFTKGPNPALSSLAQGYDNDRIASNYISSLVLSFNGSLSPDVLAATNLTFVGLNGQAAAGNIGVPLSSFSTPPSPPPTISSKWWVWLLIGLAVVGLIAGGMYLYQYFDSRKKRDSITGGSYAAGNTADDKKIPAVNDYNRDLIVDTDDVRL